jgi:hypothetical protein
MKSKNVVIGDRNASERMESMNVVLSGRVLFSKEKLKDIVITKIGRTGFTII